MRQGSAGADFPPQRWAGSISVELPCHPLPCTQVLGCGLNDWREVSDGFVPSWNKKARKHQKRAWAKPWIFLPPSWVGMEGLLPLQGWGCLVMSPASPCPAVATCTTFHGQILLPSKDSLKEPAFLPAFPSQLLITDLFLC